ncbi:MAG TPA: M13 family metallopeptidase N-terminal domain-containing protein, partial [Phenylobacterium sp.]|nr:M13 family metallopeptidase N-terminal domain-containing protein [Phenylobacterium sp.]
MKMSWFAGAALALVLAAPALTTPALAADAAAAAIEAPRQGSWGFDLAGRDLSVSPGQSFYDYANGTYVRDLVIPSDRTSFGSFDRLRELSTARMQAVVQTAGADKAAKGDEAKLGALYRSFMNEDRVNALGAKPLAPELARIKAARSASDIARIMGEHQHGFGGSAFGAFIYDDAKDPLKYTVYLGQGGLGLPDRDYYLKERFA